jgi:hypothetical protein
MKLEGDNKMNDLVNIVSTVGFPIAVAGYLLLRQEGKMDKLTEAITSLTNKIELLEKQLGTSKEVIKNE